MQDDPRLLEAKAMPMRSVVERLGVAGLKPVGHELTGPCPICGGRDRFNINQRTNAFLCRQCSIRGGDQVGLVQAVLGLDFKDALTWLCGDAPVKVDQAELARRRKVAAEAERQRQAEQARYRQRSVDAAKRIWAQGLPPEGTPVERYLDRRGLTGVLPRLTKCLRFHPALKYMHKIDGEWVELHCGPAMLAVVQAPDSNGNCVHRTWLDLDRPKGKAVIMKDGKPFLDAQGRPLKVKKSLGRTKGNAIRLCTPKQYQTLVMGEGIETTLSAMVGGLFSGAAYWAGVSLGNMAGIMQRVKGKRYSGLPDLGDQEAFVPPPWITKLVYIQDGDSDPKMTRAKLECGLLRASAFNPNLSTTIWPVPPGMDLNDVLMEGLPIELKVTESEGADG